MSEHLTILVPQCSDYCQFQFDSFWYFPTAHVQHLNYAAMSEQRPPGSRPSSFPKSSMLKGGFAL